MKLYLSLTFLLILLISCKKSDLQEEFNCNNSNYYNLEKVIDIEEKFSIKTPKTWSTKLFYNDFESTIMTADSLKSFSNTFILNVSQIRGSLNLDTNFINKVSRHLLEEEKLEVIKYKFSKFKKLPSIWFLSKGKMNKYDYHFFQLFVKKSSSDYLEISTKIYGDKLINERLCESITLMNKIELLKK